MAKQILFVEDEPGLQEILKDTLETAGFDVDLASNGLEALEKPLWKYQLIITDLCMPEVDGLKLITMIRKNAIETPIIVLTGFVELYIDKLEEFPDVAVMEKSLFDLKSFTELVSKVCS